MSNFMNYLKRNLYLILSIVVLTLTATGSIIIISVLDIGKPVAQTSVGFIYLGSVESKDYEGVLTPRITNWQNTSDYALIYQEYEWVIDLRHFTFDVQETIQNIRVNKNNKAFFSLLEANKTLLHDQITTDLNDTLIQAFDYEKLLVDIQSEMSLLKNRKNFYLTDYLDPSMKETLIDHIVITSIPALTVDAIMASTTAITLPGLSRFYIIEALSDANLSNEALSVIASALQYVTFLTPIQGYIFESYFDKPMWADLGVNVRILKMNNYNFSFYNPMREDMILHIERIDFQTLSFTLKGYPYLTRYERVIDTSTTIPFQTMRLLDLSLNDTTIGVTITETDIDITYEVVQTIGVLGYEIRYIRKTTPLHGSSIEQTLYIEQVLPVHQVILENIVSKG